MNGQIGGSGVVPQSSWQAGRLDARPGSRRLLFGRVYEDSDIERNAFAPGGRVFCIASAGCTAFALCPDHDVIACDINPEQIEYVRRRIAGGERELGGVETIMGFMRRLMPLAGWSRSTLDEFLALDQPEAQVAFWREKLDTFRFRAGLWLLLSPLSLRRFYSRELLGSLPPRFDRVLRERMARCFARHPNRENPYARALFEGATASDSEQENAPGTASRLELVVDDAAACLEHCPPGSFSGFSLSNILDGATVSYRQRLFAAVARAARPGAIVVSRSFGEPAASLDTNQAERDRSMLWGVVDVRPVETLWSSTPVHP